jgi:hypothetical protein
VVCSGTHVFRAALHPEERQTLDGLLQDGQIKAECATVMLGQDHQGEPNVVG